MSERELAPGPFNEKQASDFEKVYACPFDQGIVTRCFSGNELLSKERLIRIS